MQVKERLALTREQATAHDRASEALRKLQVQHEESASSGAQSLKQVKSNVADVSQLREYPV